MHGESPPGEISQVSSLRERGPSSIERQVIAEIRSLRNSSSQPVGQSLLAKPECLIHHLIQMVHGNIHMGIAPIARELGVGARTLERAFAREFGITMMEHRATIRLRYAQWMLSLEPSPKIAAVAASLGYEHIQDFTRFFQNRTGQSPSEWMKENRTTKSYEATVGNIAKIGSDK